MTKIFAFVLLLCSPIALAGPVLAVDEAGVQNGMQPQVTPQVVPPEPAKGAIDVNPPPVPAKNLKPASTNTGVPVAYGPDPSQRQEPSQFQNILSHMLSSLTGTNAFAPPPPDTNWDTYSYPKDYKFDYGGTSIGDIGNGLCTYKNKDKAQVENGYCAILADILTREDTCAGRAMKQILEVAQSPADGSGIYELNEFCPTWGKMTDNTQRSLVFQQILATLIVQESGWNPRAQEKPWVREDGALMGGKGLFQIGVADAKKGGDCAGINSTTILQPEANMKCGACIALGGIVEDRAMGHGTGDSGARGMAQYFGPLRDKQRPKRNAMAGAVAQYCRAATGDAAGAVEFTPITGSPENIPAATD